MYYNGDDRYDVATFLDKVHESIRISNTRGMKSFKDNSKKIQEALQWFKDEANSNESQIPQEVIGFLNKEYFQGQEFKIEYIDKKGKKRTRPDSQKLGSVLEEKFTNFLSYFYSGASPQNLGSRKIESDIYSYGNRFITSLLNSSAVKSIVKDLSRKQLDQITTFVFNPEKRSNLDKKVIEVCNKIAMNDLLLLAQEIPKGRIKGEEGFYLVEVQGKTDLYVPSEGTLNLSFLQENKIIIPDNVINGLKALKGAKLSLKNYGAKNSVTIGDTESIRGYFSVITHSNVIKKRSYEVTSSSYLHSLNLMAANKSQSSKNKEYYESQGWDSDRQKRWERTKEMIYYIRFIYELTGKGTQYTNRIKGEAKDLAQADYLVYNESNGDKIFVKSCKDIINKIVFANNSRFRKTFGNIKRPNPFHGSMYIEYNLFL